MSFLSPAFLVNKINIIGQIISVMLLVLFDDFFTSKVTFKSIDWIKSIVLQKSKEKLQKRYQRTIIKYSFEFLATILFIAYFFVGYWILSEYVIVPVLARMQGIILIIVLIFFLLFSWLLNNKRMRKKYLGYD